MCIRDRIRDNALEQIRITEMEIILTQDLIEELEAAINDDALVEAWTKVANARQDFIDKYSYIDAKGKKRSIDSYSDIPLHRSNPKRAEFFRAMQALAASKQMSTIDILEQLKEDHANLQDVKRKYNISLREQNEIKNNLQLSRERLIKMDNALELFEQESHMADLLLAEKTIGDAMDQLVKNYNKYQNERSITNVPKDQITKEPEATNKGNESFNRTSESAIPTSAGHTTGLHFMYDYSKGTDILVEDIDSEGNPIKVAKPNDSEYQRAFFNFTDTYKMSDKYGLMFVTPDYSSEKGLNVHFAKNNPVKGNRSVDDVMAVVVKRGTSEPVMVKGKDGKIPLFTAMKKVDKMFPRKGKPEIAMKGMFNEVYRDAGLGTVGAVYAKNPKQKLSNNQQKILNKFLGGTYKTVGDVTNAVINYNKNKYNEFLHSVRSEPRYADIDGITNGHTVKILQKDGTVKKHNPLIVFKDRLGPIKKDGKKTKGGNQYEVQIASSSGQVQFSDKKTVRGKVPGTAVLKLKTTGQVVPLYSNTLSDGEVRVITFLLEQAGKSDLDTNLLLGEDMGENLKDNYYKLGRSGQRITSKNM